MKPSSSHMSYTVKPTTNCRCPFNYTSSPRLYSDTLCMHSKTATTTSCCLHYTKFAHVLYHATGCSLHNISKCKLHEDFHGRLEVKLGSPKSARHIAMSVHMYIFYARTHKPYLNYWKTLPTLARPMYM